MTSYESMAAQLAAVASLHGLQTPQFSGLSQFQPGNFILLSHKIKFFLTWDYFTALWYQQFVQQMPSVSTEREHTAKSPSTKITVNNESATGTEQPLDLSAKSSSSSMLTDSKQIFK